MIRQRDYTLHSGLSKGHVSQLVRRGMPLDSVQAADTWRARHTLVRKLPPPTPAPAPSLASAAPERPAELPTEDLAAGACEPIREAWGRLLQAERIAWAAVVQSIRGRQPDASRLVGVHAQCVKNLIDGRSRVLAQAQSERTLVSGDWVRRVMQEHDGIVAALARGMPRQLAGRVNPTDPCHAERELARWLNETFLATLSSTDPWKA
jgi:hypothetical protein